MNQLSRERLRRLAKDGDVSAARLLNRLLTRENRLRSPSETRSRIARVVLEHRQKLLRPRPRPTTTPRFLRRTHSRRHPLRRRFIKSPGRAGQILEYTSTVAGIPMRGPYFDRTLPKTRGDCPASRPCPFVSCRHHLDVAFTTSGRIRLSRGLSRLLLDGDVAALNTESCALDIADRGGATLDEVGEVLGITREAVRLIERKALQKLKNRITKGQKHA